MVKDTDAGDGVSIKTLSGRQREPPPYFSRVNDNDENRNKRHNIEKSGVRGHLDLMGGR